MSEELFADTFDRADADVLGGNWLEVSGDWDIVTNGVRCFSSGAATVINTTSLNTADYKVSVSVSADGLWNAAGGMGLVARYVDANNNYFAWLDPDTDSVRLYRWLGGVLTPLSNYQALAPLPVDPFTMTISCHGPVISLEVGGFGISVTDSSLPAAGNFGFRTFDAANFGGHLFHSVVVESTALTPTPAGHLSYASVDELKGWITSNSTDMSDDVDDEGLQLALDASTRLIDVTCGRRFVFEAGATKLYYPSSTDSVDVVDLITATSIESDSHGDRTFSTLLEPTEYELLPYVDGVGAPAVRFQEVRIWQTSSRSFTPGNLVRIIGDFGFVESGNTVPPEVKQANLIHAARLWKRRETPLGILGSTDLGTFERMSKDDPDVAALLAPYVRAGTWVLV